MKRRKFITLIGAVLILATSRPLFAEVAEKFTVEAKEGGMALARYEADRNCADPGISDFSGSLA
jgi:hypothetical protein